MEDWINKIEYLRIDDPRIYTSEFLSPDYSQEEDLSYSNIKKLRNKWIDILPTLENLKYLFLGHRVNQDYFEAICKIPNLKGLEVKVSQITDFSSIGKLKQLEDLNFCGSKGIASLKGIEQLTNLKYCRLSHIFGVNTITELSVLKSLEKLVLFGSIHGQVLNIKNVDFLSNLLNLEILVLDIKPGVKLESLFKLEKLKHLSIPDQYHSEMKGRLPKQVELK